MHSLCRDLQRRTQHIIHERLPFLSLSPGQKRIAFYVIVVLCIYLMVSADYRAVKKARETSPLRRGRAPPRHLPNKRGVEGKKESRRGRLNPAINVESLLKPKRSERSRVDVKKSKSQLPKKRRRPDKMDVISTMNITETVKSGREKKLIGRVKEERNSDGGEVKEDEKPIKLVDDRKYIGEVKNIVKDRKRTKGKRVSNAIKTTRKMKMVVKKEEEIQCKIPHLSLHSDEIDHLFFEEKLKCTGGENWAAVEGGRMKVKRRGATCYGQEIIRVNDEGNERGVRKELKDGDILTSESTFVSCIEEKQHWEGILWTVIKKEERVEELTKIRLDSNGSGVSIVIMSFDSMSQANFRRKLPKTVSALEKTMGSVIMNGYNIVGDGTPQAFLPILTGKTEVELPMTRKKVGEAKFVDQVYPFIWNNFSSHGYITAFIEDSANAGMFNYRLKGFDKPPVDHYGRTHFVEWEKTAAAWYVPCYGSEPQHKQWFRYAKELLQSYKDQPKFILTHHGTYSHQSVNTIGNIDDDFTVWIENSSREGLFNNTVLIVMADHGHRFSSLRDTHQGQLEERLPFFSISIPRELRETKTGEKMLTNLRGNIDRLVTPFDVHQTLFDLLHLKKDYELTKEQSPTTRSLSMFRPIPKSRSCKNAGIPVHWCTCLAWKDASTLPISREIVNSVVSSINNLTESERKLCAPLYLKDVFYVKKLFTTKDVLKYSKAKDADGFVAKLEGKAKEAFSYYQIKFSTRPGRAIYEATLKFVNSKNATEVDFRSISHVSKYGDDSHCIRDKNTALLEYCVCYDKFTDKS